jgi:hypothetical protein
MFAARHAHLCRANRIPPPRCRLRTSSMSCAIKDEEQKPLIKKLYAR